MIEEGQLQLQIGFGRDGRPEQQYTSEPVVVHQLSWIIQVNQETTEDNDWQHHLRCHVICNSENPDTGWSCVAYVALRLFTQNRLLAKSEWVRTFDHQKNFEYAGFFLSQLRHGTIIVEADIKIGTSYVPKIRATLSDRMMRLLSNGKDANVHFLVGTGDGKKERFAAHKGILATSSDVFDKMFDYDANRGNSDKVIEIPDVTPEAFRVMLNFIYTTDLRGLNLRNAFDVLHAAAESPWLGQEKLILAKKKGPINVSQNSPILPKRLFGSAALRPVTLTALFGFNPPKKYNIADLVDACADCPKLVADNVLYALSKALFYDVKSLTDRCWKFIDQNACDVLENNKFVQIDQALLEDLFARDQLMLRNGEIAVWNAALRWADAQCHKLNLEIAGGNRRKMLGRALFNIRFPLIQKDKFSSAIVPTKVLTKEEMLSVLLYHEHPTNGIPNEYPLLFSSKSRSSMTAKTSSFCKQPMVKVLCFLCIFTLILFVLCTKNIH